MPRCNSFNSIAFLAYNEHGSLQPWWREQKAIIGLEGTCHAGKKFDTKDRTLINESTTITCMHDSCLVREVFFAISEKLSWVFYVN